MRARAITGVGVVSPIAVGWEQWTAALADPADAERRAFDGRPTTLSEERCAGACVAEVWGFEAEKYLGKKGIRNFDRLTRFLIVAARHALEDAGIKKDGEFVQLDPARVGVCSSTAYGSLDAITELNLVAELEDPRYINPARFPNTVINAAAGYVSIWEGLRAPNVTVVDGNCGALDAVLSCDTHLSHRRGDAFLVGGGDVVSEPLYLAFKHLGVVAAGGGTDEPGMRPGEGSAYLCVERLPEAEARGARIRGVIAGYGTAFEAPVSPAVLVHASADSVRRAVDAAVADAGLRPSDVAAVVSAAGGIEAIDAAERTGIAAALGPEVAVAAPKRYTGESFGAAGALGMAVALAWMEGAPVAPITSGDAPSELAAVVITTVGFYGNVSAVVLRRP